MQPLAEHPALLNLPRFQGKSVKSLHYTDRITPMKPMTTRPRALPRRRRVYEVTKAGGKVNHSLVASGNAFVYWQYINGCDRQTYSRLEWEARLKGLGVWSIPVGLERSRDYIHQQRKANTRVATASSKTVSTPNSQRYRCREISSWSKAQEMLKEGHGYLDRD